MTFIKTAIFILDDIGTLQRRPGEVPSVVGHPRIKVSTPAEADNRETAKLLRRMADQIEISTAGNAAGTTQGDQRNETMG